MKHLGKILVTGVAGFLGSRLAERLRDQGHEIIGNDNLTSGYKDNIPEGIEFHKTDCRDFEGMKKISKSVDILYHCAAYPYEGLSVFSPAIVNDSISQATAATLSSFIQNNGRRFVFCSSMARYGMNQTPFTEDMETRPQDPYAVAKVQAEQLIKLMSRAHDFEYSIAVPHNIFGPGQIYNDPFRNVAGIFINTILRGQQPVIYGNGEQRRCFSYIEDDLPPLIAMGMNKNTVGETINIGPDEEFVTINHLAETIADITGFKLSPRYFPDRPQEVKDANCSADKARRLLMFKTQHSLRAGLTEMIQWVEKRGPKEFNYHLPLEIINDKTPETWKKRLM